MSKIKRKQISALFAQGVWAGNATIPAAGSVDVSSFFAGKTGGGSASVVGILTSDPYNRIDMRLASTKSTVLTSDTEVQVFGKLTYATGVWTLTFYTVVAGVDTPYEFQAADPNVGLDIGFRYCEVVEFKDLNPLAAVNYGESFTSVHISGTAGNSAVETLTVTADGQTAFVLAHAPAPADAAKAVLTVNGIRYQYTTDFTITGADLVWNNNSCTLETSDSVMAEYTY